MTIAPSPYEIVRAIQEQQRATDRLVAILIGMLDRSAPDPFLSAELPVDGDTRAVSVPRGSRRVAGDSARPPVMFVLDGVEFRTTDRRAKLLHAAMAAPLTLSEMTRKGVAGTVDAVKQQIKDVNADIARAGIGKSVRIVATPAQRIGARGGREPAVYTLLPIESATAAETIQKSGSLTPPEVAEANPPAGEAPPLVTQPAGSTVLPETASGVVGGFPVAAAPHHAEETGVLPSTRQRADLERGKDLCVTGGERPAPHPEIAGELTAINSGQMNRLPDQGPVGREECKAAQLGPSTCETPSGADTGRDVEAVPPSPAAKVRAAPKPSAKPQIEPGDLIAVDVKQGRVTTAKGSYLIAGSSLGRALDKLKGGDMFGLDVIAKVAGWHSAEVASQALRLERLRLLAYGVDLYLDKINVRLRSAA